MDRDLFESNDIEKLWRKRFEENEQWIKVTARESDLKQKLNHELIDWLVEHDYHMLSLPETYGGGGADIKSVVYIQEVLASLDESTALSIGWHLGIIGEVFEGNLWKEDMMNELVDALKQGAIVNRIVSEAEMGSPTRGAMPATRAEETDDGFVINGVKTFASMSHRLTHYIVGAFNAEKKAMCFYYVPANTPGIEIKDTWNAFGMRGTESHDIIFKDVKIPKRYLVEETRERKANPWLLHIPAVYMGIAEHAIREAIDYSRSYQPASLEYPISELPHIQDKIAQMGILMMEQRHFIYHACDLHKSGKTEQLQPTFSLAKYMIVNNSIKITDLAMRIVGAKSLDQDKVFERLYRSARAGLHNPPMDDATEKVIRNSFLKHQNQ